MHDFVVDHGLANHRNEQCVFRSKLQEEDTQRVHCDIAKLGVAVAQSSDEWMDDLRRVVGKIDFSAQLSGRTQSGTSKLFRSERVLKTLDDDRKDEVEIVFDARPEHIECAEDMQKRVEASFWYMFRREFAIERSQDLLEQPWQIRLELALDRPRDRLHQLDDGDLENRIWIPKVVNEAEDVVEVISNMLFDD